MVRIASACGVLAALVFVAPAIAADFPPSTPAPTRAPLAAPEPAYLWTGIYFGGHGGGVWGDETSTTQVATAFAPAGTVVKGSPTGGLAGGQVGANFQYGSWLVGVEADGSWTNATDTVDSVLGPVTARGASDANWFATLTGRFGYAAGNVLFYGKGGAAWMNVDYTASVLVTGSNAIFAGPATITDTRNGWTVGGGIEFGFWHNWSARIEYDYLNFGTRSYTFTLGGVANPINIESQFHMVKGGINYRFGWPG